MRLQSGNENVNALMARPFHNPPVTSGWGRWLSLAHLFGSTDLLELGSEIGRPILCTNGWDYGRHTAGTAVAPALPGLWRPPN